MKIFNVLKQWWNGPELLSPIKIEKIEAKYRWDIQPDITAYELSNFVVLRVFRDGDTIDKWYNELPDNIKRHLKKIE